MVASRAPVTGALQDPRFAAYVTELTRQQPMLRQDWSKLVADTNPSRLINHRAKTTFFVIPHSKAAPPHNSLTAKALNEPSIRERLSTESSAAPTGKSSVAYSSRSFASSDSFGVSGDKVQLVKTGETSSASERTTTTRPKLKRGESRKFNIRATTERHASNHAEKQTGVKLQRPPISRPHSSVPLTCINMDVFFQREDIMFDREQLTRPATAPGYSSPSPSPTSFITATSTAATMAQRSRPPPQRLMWPHHCIPDREIGRDDDHSVSPSPTFWGHSHESASQSSKVHVSSLRRVDNSEVSARKMANVTGKTSNSTTDISTDSRTVRHVRVTEPVSVPAGGGMSDTNSDPTRVDAEGDISTTSSQRKQLPLPPVARRAASARAPLNTAVAAIELAYQTEPPRHAGLSSVSQKLAWFAATQRRQRQTLLQHPSPASDQIFSSFPPTSSLPTSAPTVPDSGALSIVSPLADPSALLTSSLSTAPAVSTHASTPPKKIAVIDLLAPQSTTTRVSMPSVSAIMAAHAFEQEKRRATAFPSGGHGFDSVIAGMGDPLSLYSYHHSGQHSSINFTFFPRGLADVHAHINNQTDASSFPATVASTVLTGLPLSSRPASVATYLAGADDFLSGSADHEESEKTDTKDTKDRTKNKGTKKKKKPAKKTKRKVKPSAVPTAPVIPDPPTIHDDENNVQAVNAPPPAATSAPLPALISLLPVQNADPEGDAHHNAVFDEAAVIIQKMWRKCRAKAKYIQNLESMVGVQRRFRFSRVRRYYKRRQEDLKEAKNPVQKQKIISELTRLSQLAAVAGVPSALAIARAKEAAAAAGQGQPLGQNQ